MCVHTKWSYLCYLYALERGRKFISVEEGGDIYRSVCVGGKCQKVQRTAGGTLPPPLGGFSTAQRIELCQEYLGDLTSSFPCQLLLNSCLKSAHNF